MILSRAGKNMPSRPRGSQLVQNRSPVFVCIGVGDGISHPPASFPCSGTGGSPVGRVTTQLGNTLDFFFGIGHKMIITGPSDLVGDQPTAGYVSPLRKGRPSAAGGRRRAVANRSTTSTAMWGVMAGSWFGTLVELKYQNPMMMAAKAR